MKYALAAAVLLATCQTATAEAPRLGPPIACAIGETCWIQQYVDHDPSAGVLDYACGGQTYDGHDGTDIRIRDTASRADVIASAAGTVKAVRDGVDDKLMKSSEDRAAVARRECGNGVLIDHGQGWETQYCHLRKDTIAVTAGDRVVMGQRLGEVGYSGMAAFPHVHLALRKDGRDIDPFRPAGATQQRCGIADDALWVEDARAALVYQPGAIIASGFAPGAVEKEQLESGETAGTAPGGGWPAIVAYGWAINLQAGDEVTIELDGPDGLSAINTAKLDRAKADYMLFAGKKRPPGGWPAGRYAGRLTVRNGGTMRLVEEWDSHLP